jgi:hypothetical protein
LSVVPAARRSTPGFRRHVLARTVCALAGLSALAASVPPPDEPAAPPGTAEHRPVLLFGEEFPVEARVAFPAALLHWLDSLAHLDGAGMTAGKTVETHRAEYNDLFGPPGTNEVDALRRYREIRVRHADDALPGGAPAVTRAFLSAATIDEALSAASPPLDASSAAALRAALDHFAPRYRRIWADGKISRRFVDRVVDDPARPDLARFLLDVARFYRVSPAAQPHAVVLPVPVRAGAGTHAQAIGPYLLIEVRRSDELRDEVGPIVHEIAHFLFMRVDAARSRALHETARRADDRGERAWRLMLEALPTAIAQGEASRRFDKRWNPVRPWYHDPEVDAYAKALFPLVRRALDNGETFDADFARRAVEALPAEP